MSQQWTSRVGHILAAAGSAIGIGTNLEVLFMSPPIMGGGAFLVVFLLFSFIIGLAVLLAENILGSSTHAEAVNAFKKMMGRNWVIIGVIGVFSSWCIYSFYSVVGGGLLVTPLWQLLVN